MNWTQLHGVAPGGVTGVGASALSSFNRQAWLTLAALASARAAERASRDAAARVLLDWNQRVLHCRQPRVSRTASTGHGSGTPFSS